MQYLLNQITVQIGGPIVTAAVVEGKEGKLLPNDCFE